MYYNIIAEKYLGKSILMAITLFKKLFIASFLGHTFLAKHMDRISS
jgi:hypothetical protein